MTDKEPAGIAAGRVFNAIAELPPDQAALVYALPQRERTRLMALDEKAREAAIAELRKPKQTAVKAAEKGDK